MSQKNRYSCTHVLELFENTNILERNIELEAAVGLDLDLSAAQCVLAASIRSSHKVKLIGILLYIARNTISQFGRPVQEGNEQSPFGEISFFENIDVFTKVW